LWNQDLLPEAGRYILHSVLSHKLFRDQERV